MLVLLLLRTDKIVGNNKRVLAFEDCDSRIRAIHKDSSYHTANVSAKRSGDNQPISINLNDFDESILDESSDDSESDVDDAEHDCSSSESASNHDSDISYSDTKSVDSAASIVDPESINNHDNELLSFYVNDDTAPITKGI